jgi:hypothetical protein
LLAFWQQRAGAHCCAGTSRRLTICPAVGFERRTVTSSELYNAIRRWWLCLAAWTQPEGHFVRSRKRITDHTSKSAGLSIFLFILNTH